MTSTDTDPSLPLAPRKTRKILIAGHVGAGKTTVLQTLFGDQALTTDARYSEAVMSGKTSTTVAMDYGVIDCPASNDRLHIYAIPGQERFQFMWEILSKNAAGILLLMDARISKPLQAIHLYLDRILPYLHQPAGVVALNKLSNAERGQLHLPAYLRHGDLRLRLTTTDVRNQEEVLTLLRLLIGEIGQRNAMHDELSLGGIRSEAPKPSPR
ncbi:ATP/GTP-binding protein [Acidithiobacillus sp. IBUN Pt1247-S3]|uniref:GTP-binding protein n=1 Tax=Acidithiobacillus sp. IBUN Pt1247-S3 TaxID=3166642 RepID=UPI0034E5C18A